jgi:hypothetical protein
MTTYGGQGASRIYPSQGTSSPITIANDKNFVITMDYTLKK